MIESEEELAITKKQLAIVERIVESWRQDLLPHNPRNFALYAEGAIEQAEKLQAQIDEYLQRRGTLPAEVNAASAVSEHPPATAS